MKEQPFTICLELNQLIRFRLTILLKVLNPLLGSVFGSSV